MNRVPSLTLRVLGRAYFWFSSDRIEGNACNSATTQKPATRHPQEPEETEEEKSIAQPRSPAAG